MQWTLLAAGMSLRPGECLDPCSLSHLQVFHRHMYHCANLGMHEEQSHNIKVYEEL